MNEQIGNPEEKSKKPQYGKEPTSFPGSLTLPVYLLGKSMFFVNSPSLHVPTRNMVIPHTDDHGDIRSPRKPAQQYEVCTGTGAISKHYCHYDHEQEHNGLSWVLVSSPINKRGDRHSKSETGRQHQSW